MTLEKIIKYLKLDWEKTNGLLVLHTFNFSFGAGLGALGKSTKNEFIPFIPPTIDIFYCGRLNKGYISYGLGVAINYIPEIYQFVQNIL